MVNYRDGEIGHIIPSNLLSPEVQAASFAVAEERQQFLKFATATSLYAAVGEVPETVLDLMALELNTQYYEQNLPREIKERLVSQTLVWYMHAGTPSVLDEFLRTILAGGYVEEWHEYGGSPYYFKAFVRADEDDEILPGCGNAVKQQISVYKNARSWLDSFAFILGTGFHVETTFNSRLELISEFYARNNRSFLLLGGTWFLDNRYRLNGYKTIAIDFFPMQLNAQGDFIVPVRTGDNGGIEIEGEAKAGVQLSMLQKVCSNLDVLEKNHNQLLLAARTDVNPGLGETHLRVEKNLWYMDGKKLLEGAKIFNAQVFEYGL